MVNFGSAAVIEAEDCDILANLTSLLPEHRGYLEQGRDTGTEQPLNSHCTAIV
jgi:hypothetical protein